MIQSRLWDTITGITGNNLGQIHIETNSRESLSEARPRYKVHLRAIFEKAMTGNGQLQHPGP
jgi:hypothetical protein